MNASLIAIIGSAIAAARQVGLDGNGQRDTARAVLLARDATLTPGIAKILVEQLYESIQAQSEPELVI